MITFLSLSLLISSHYLPSTVTSVHYEDIIFVAQSWGYFHSQATKVVFKHSKVFNKSLMFFRGRAYI